MRMLMDRILFTHFSFQKQFPASLTMEKHLWGCHASGNARMVDIQIMFFAF